MSSYIFSGNGNNYTFKKLDNMLINLPTTDGQHVLIRSSEDGDVRYSWSPVSIVVNVGDIKSYVYNPTTTIPVNATESIEYEIPQGLNILTIRCLLYNASDVDCFKDCTSIEDVLNMNYFFEIKINETSVMQYRIINTLNNIYTIESTVVYENPSQSLSTINFNTNMESLQFLGGVDGVTLLFENFSSETVNV